MKKGYSMHQGEKGIDIVYSQINGRYKDKEKVIIVVLKENKQPIKVNQNNSKKVEKVPIHKIVQWQDLAT